MSILIGADFFPPRAKDELPPPLSFPFPFPPFRSRPPINTARGLGLRCKLPQWGLGQSRSRQTIWCILESTSAALAAAVFVDFPKNKCHFLHKTSLMSSYVGSNSSQDGALWGVFLLGQSPPLPCASRRLCPCWRYAADECVDDSSCISAMTFFTRYDVDLTDIRTAFWRRRQCVNLFPAAQGKACCLWKVVKMSRRRFQLSEDSRPTTRGRSALDRRQFC